MKLSIIVPVFNETNTVSRVIRKLSALKIPKVQKEIIIVDDGSIDTTPSKIRKITARIKDVKTIFHQKNLGKGEAIKNGIKQATGDYIIIQDADLEYNPDLIPLLINPIQKRQTEVVYGTRLKHLPYFLTEEKTFLFLLHYLGNRIISLLMSIFYGQWITDIETGYKIFPKRALENINLEAKGFDFEPEITSKLLKSGYRILEIPISVYPRNYNEGKKFKTFKDGGIALWSVIKYKFQLESFLSQKRAKIANNLINNKLRKGRILDLGCGHFPYFLISTKFDQKYGLDLHVDELTKKKIIFQRINLEKKKIPFPDNYFDVITMLAVLEHLRPENNLGVFKEIFRVLKPNGQLVMTTPSWWSALLLQFLSRIGLISKIEIDDHKKLYNFEQVRNLLQKTGFLPKKIKNGFFELYLNMWFTAQK
jgi:dolichol-phosphate mannosyltransferase